MADLTAGIEAVSAALGADHDRQAAELGRWRELFFALGRASQAASAGDTTAARRWLTEAEGIEYDLRGDCDRIGALVEALDAREAEAQALDAAMRTPLSVDWPEALRRAKEDEHG